MAREMTETAVCDVDGGSEDVESVTVFYRGRTFVVDLCVNETAILETWEQAGSAAPRKGGTPVKKQAGHKVVPID